MKKIVLLSISLFFANNTFSQTINIPDAVFKNKLISAGVDTNNDGEIQQSEALVKTVLEIGKLSSALPNITSLQGIEYFTNLTKLDCTGHQITTLDVTALINLEIFNCSRNALSSVNIAGMSNLKRFSCNENDLETLNLAGLNNLQSITCSHNSLTSINFNDTPNLTRLSCDYNQLNSLENLPLQLSELYVDNNNLTQLNVNNLSQLRWFNCSNNVIATIDVSNMPLLEHFFIAGNLLTEIDCRQSGVFRLDCSNNPDLKYIFVKNNIVSISDPDLLYYGMSFYQLPALEFICVDAGEEYALSVSGYNDLNQNAVVSVNSCELSTDDFHQKSISIYPNPVKDYVVIASEGEVENIVIFDTLGRKVFYSSDVNSTQQAIVNLNSGVYFLKLALQNGQYESTKFIKQ